MAGRYGRNFWTNWSKVVWGKNEAEPSGEWPSTRNGQIAGFDYTWTLINPALVFSLRGGLSRYWNFSGNEYGGGFNPATLGLPGFPGEAVHDAPVPAIRERRIY